MSKDSKLSQGNESNEIKQKTFITTNEELHSSECHKNLCFSPFACRFPIHSTRIFSDLFQILSLNSYPQNDFANGQSIHNCITIDKTVIKPFRRLLEWETQQNCSNFFFCCAFCFLFHYGYLIRVHVGIACNNDLFCLFVRLFGQKCCTKRTKNLEPLKYTVEYKCIWKWIFKLHVSIDIFVL